jgi:hypothetical protein
MNKKADSHKGFHFDVLNNKMTMKMTSEFALVILSVMGANNLDQ